MFGLTRRRDCRFDSRQLCLMPDIWLCRTDYSGAQQPFRVTSRLAEPATFSSNIRRDFTAILNISDAALLVRLKRQFQSSVGIAFDIFGLLSKRLSLRRHHRSDV